MENKVLSLCVSIILLYQLLCIECQESVRLVGGGSAYEGQVEVLICTSSTNCAWNNVCTNGWSSYEATVTCRQIGLNARTISFASHHHQILSRVRIDCNASSYGALRYCTVQPVTSCGSSNRAGVICYSPPGPERPIFRHPSLYSTSAIIQWNSIVAAVKYHIICSNGYHTHTASTASITLGGLMPYTTYSCCISGVNSNNVVGSEGCTTFQTRTGTPRVPPSGLRYTVLQSRFITLHWEQLTTAEIGGPQNSVSYRVRVDGCNHNNVKQGISNTYMSITSLCPNSMYSISVKACTSTCGSFSPEIQIKTLEDASSSVNSLSCNAVSPTQVNVVWPPPSQTNGVIRHYEITLLNINTTQISTKFVNGNMTSATIDHLHPNHHYSCSIAAHTIVRGMSNFARQTVSLPQSSAPEHFSCTVHSSNSLQLGWSQPSPLEQNGPIDRYLAFVWNVDTNEVVYSNSTLFSTTTTSSTALATALPLYHNYNCSVAAYGRFGLGPFVFVPVWIPDTVHFGPPQNLQYTRLTSTSVTITWSPPRVKYNHAHIRNYLITVYSNETQRDVVSEHHSAARYQVRYLHPNYHYKINVSGVTDSNLSGPSEVQDIQTSEDVPTSAPQNLSTSAISSSSFMLEWNEPPAEHQNGRIRGYDVRVVPQVEHPTSMKLSTENSAVLVSSLKESTIHRVSVAARTSVGIGPYSEPISIKTKKDLLLEMILYSIAGFALLLLIGVSVGLCVCVYKNNMCRKKLSMQDTHESVVVSNALPTESSSEDPDYEYSKLSLPETKKRVKPPAVPPKMCCEPDVPASSITRPIQVEVQRETDDICSVASDSLYDMQLETLNEKQLPERNENSELLQTTHESVFLQEPDARHNIPDECSKSKLSRQNLAAGLGTNVILDQDHDYQTLDTKTLSPPSMYEDVQCMSVPTYKHHQHRTTPDSHYEQLQLKTINKESKYEHLLY